jgi:nitrous oxide reductase accessory protein NosL
MKYCEQVMKHFLSLLSLLALLTSCSNNSGPIDINWDRDTCEHCKMALSDKHFATQIQGGPQNKTHLFDDLGCAINWLQDQPWGTDATTKIWVTDYRNGQWLDARHAYYMTGQLTPMDYGLGAVAEPLKGSINFQMATTQLLAKSPKHQH